MNDKRAHARAWLAEAESDRLAARRLLDAGGPFDAVCFHAQQACEKALKAILAWAETEIPHANRLLTVVFTIRGSLLRVISARPMSRPERKRHDQATNS